MSLKQKVPLFHKNSMTLTTMLQYVTWFGPSNCHSFLCCSMQGQTPTIHFSCHSVTIFNEPVKNHLFQSFTLHPWSPIPFHRVTALSTCMTFLCPTKFSASFDAAFISIAILCIKIVCFFCGWLFTYPMSSFSNQFLIYNVRSFCGIETQCPVALLVFSCINWLDWCEHHGQALQLPPTKFNCSLLPSLPLFQLGLSPFSLSSIVFCFCLAANNANCTSKMISHVHILFNFPSSICFLPLQDNVSCSDLVHLSIFNLVPPIDLFAGFFH